MSSGVWSIIVPSLVVIGLIWWSVNPDISDGLAGIPSAVLGLADEFEMTDVSTVPAFGVLSWTGFTLEEVVG